MKEKIITIPYTPRDAQREIHNALDTHRYSVIIAHRRLGKSMAAINHLIRYAFTHSMPNIRMAYISPTFKQTKQIAFKPISIAASTLPIPTAKTPML